MDTQTITHDRARPFTDRAKPFLLLFKVVAPLAAVVLALIALLHLVYLRDPDKTNQAKGLSIDQMIVLKQLARSESIKSDLGFLGDSSCLMGVSAPDFPSTFGQVQSFCTLAYVGPAGYAVMLEHMLASGSAPSHLIVMFHPVQFQREESWDSWVSIVRNGGIKKNAISPPWSAFDYLRFEWLGKWLYSPLPGNYAFFYGGGDEFSTYIGEHRGSAIDPGVLKDRSVQEASFLASKAEKAYDYSLSPSYLPALDQLRSAIERFGKDRVSLVVSPIPEAYFFDRSGAERQAAAMDIATRIGIDHDQIIDTPGSYPDGFFSTTTHLNRIGRKVFTADLVRALAASGN